MRSDTKLLVWFVAFVALLFLALIAPSAFAQGPTTASGAPVVGADVLLRTGVAWTSATSIDTALTLAIPNTPTVSITMRSTTTITAGALNFEATDDGTNWFGVSVARMNTGLADLAYTIPASTSQAWQVNVGGFTSFRVRLNPAITGTGTVNVGLTAANVGGQTQIIATTHGVTAHAGVAAGNPELLGAYAESDAAALDSANVAEGDISRLKSDLEGRLLVAESHPRRVRCTITSTATTSTLVTGCSAPGAGLSIYVTDVSWYSSIISTTANFMRLQSGTGGTCGTPTVLYDGYAQVAFSGREFNLQTPWKLTANHELCFVHAGAGTRLVNISGYIAP